MPFICSQTGKIRSYRPGFGQGRAALEKTFTKKVRSHWASDSAQRPVSTGGAPNTPITHKGKGEAECPHCPTWGVRSKGYLSE